MFCGVIQISLDVFLGVDFPLKYMMWEICYAVIPAYWIYKNEKIYKLMKEIVTCRYNHN